jgi:hypothetical protein
VSVVLVSSTWTRFKKFAVSSSVSLNIIIPYYISKTERVWLIWHQTNQARHTAKIESGAIMTRRMPELNLAPYVSERGSDYSI